LLSHNITALPAMEENASFPDSWASEKPRAPEATTRVLPAEQALPIAKRGDKAEPPMFAEPVPGAAYLQMGAVDKGMAMVLTAVLPATLKLYFADDATGLCAFFGCSANELAAGADGGLRARALADLFRNGPVLGDPSRCSFRGSHQVIWLTHEDKFRCLRAR
jgi:hypothetical protein